MWRRFLLISFLTFLGTACLNEGLLFILGNPNRIALRHNVDLLANYPPKAPNSGYNVIMGDSVLNQVLESFETPRGYIDLTTNQAVGVAGNYYLLERFLAKNLPPEHLWIGFNPQMYLNDLNDKLAYTYFFSVFNRPSEKDDYLQTGLGYNGFDLPIESLIKQRLDLASAPMLTFNFFLRERIRKTSRFGSPMEAKSRTKEIVRVERSQQATFSMHPLNRAFLSKISALAQKKHIKLHILINPFIHERGSYENLKNSLQITAEVTDFNDLRNYPAECFYDGVHLRDYCRKDFYSDLIKVLFLKP